MCKPMPAIWGMKRNGQGDAWMFIGGMTNERIRTCLPNAFFVLWLPSGPQWKQCCSASNTHLLPDASESQKQDLGALLLLTPPPPHPPYCMVTKHTDRQSKSRQPSLCSCLWRLTSVPDKTSQPFPQLLLRVHTRLKVCKLCNWHIDICMYTLHPAKCLHCFQSVAGANTQRMNPSPLYEVSYNS